MLLKDLIDTLSQNNETSAKIVNQIITNYMLNKNHHENIYKIVSGLSYLTGDFQIETDNDNIKASLFWVAVFIKDLSLIKLLLNRSDSSNFINATGTFKDENLLNVTPLSVACQNNPNFNIVITLLKNKAQLFINEAH